MGARFVNMEGANDDFRPNYGGIDFTRRLNERLEEVEAVLSPIHYYEEGKDPMQVNQENTHIFINQIADEMDCVVVIYDGDGGDIATWYFREKFKEESFEDVVAVIGPWACQVVTLYPLETVVEQYENIEVKDISDFIPEDW
jgi:hypothetical protein